MYRNVVLAVVVAGTFFMLLGMTIFSSPKIGVVRSSDLIANNDMTKDEIGRWNNMESGLKADILSLEAELKQLQGTLDTSDVSSHALILQQFGQKRTQLKTMQDQLFAKMAERESAIMQAVLARINHVAQQYGEAQGFDIILGSGGDGNILYGRETVDITDAVIAAMNKEYNDAN